MVCFYRSWTSGSFLSEVLHPRMRYVILFCLILALLSGRLSEKPWKMFHIPNCCRKEKGKAEKTSAVSPRSQQKHSMQKVSVVAAKYSQNITTWHFFFTYPLWWWTTNFFFMYNYMFCFVEYGCNAFPQQVAFIFQYTSFMVPLCNVKYVVWLRRKKNKGQCALLIVSQTCAMKRQ